MMEWMVQIMKMGMGEGSCLNKGHGETEYWGAGAYPGAWGDITRREGKGKGKVAKGV